MDALIALVWDTEILVTLAILGYVLGFIFKNQIFLRLLVLIATIFYILYSTTIPKPPFGTRSMAAS